nr:ATP synthase F0 subunit 6 [Dipseliopoda setosa]
MNLFSSFDPSSNFYIQMNWSSALIGMLILPMSFWLLPSRMIFFWNKIFSLLNKEIKILLKSNLFKGYSIMMISLFLFIFFNNFMGLFPYIFTSSSHIIFSFSLSFSLWLSLMMYGWLNNTNHMFSHLIPENTPKILMPLMVCIETISNIIRPITLAIRLSANLIAGHLLLALLGNIMMMSNIYMISILIFIQMLLMFLECAVSMIQAYVFMILMTLYSSEIN